MGDLNRDGKLDLAVANGGSSTVSVLLNTGAPSIPALAPAPHDFGTQALSTIGAAVPFTLTASATRP